MRGWCVLLAGVAVGAAGWLAAAPVLVLAGCTLVLLPAVVLVGLLVRRADVVVQRRFTPGTGTAGRPVTETVRLAAPRRGVGAVAFADEVPWLRGGTAVAGARLGRGDAVSAAFRVDDAPRGRHRVGPLRLDLVEAYGLARRRVAVGPVAELVVVPEVHAVRGSRPSRALGEGARRRREHSLSGGEDDPVTREYRLGDPLRRVHWKATARLGELMVRQEEQHGLPLVRVVLPTSSAGWADAAPVAWQAAPVSESFEWAVSTVATLAVDLARAGSATLVAGLDGRLLARHDGEDADGFLEQAADVALDATVGGDAPSSGGREPLVVLVSGATVAELEALARLRPVGSPATVLVVEPAMAFALHGRAAARAPLPPATVAARLREQGWRVHVAGPADDPAEALQLAGALDG
ncbi:DUF58 domain-containing protein [Frigoribacterium salinisoli]